MSENSAIDGWCVRTCGGWRGRGRFEALAARYQESWLETGTLQPEAIHLYVSFGYSAVDPYGEFKDDLRSRCFMRSLNK